MFCRKGRTRRRVSFSLPYKQESGSANAYLLMQRLPLWMRLAYWMPPLRPAMQAPICFYSKTLLNCLPGLLPDHAFHLQIKKRSQNFGRVQAGPFHEVINVHRLVGVEQVILFLLLTRSGPFLTMAWAT